MDYTKNEVLQYVAENDVKFIKLFFTDIFGAVKSISIQPSLLAKAFETGVSFDASAVKGFLNEAQSDLFLVPDPKTLSVLPWRPQHGRVARLYCNIVYPDGTPFEGDSRRILEQQISACQESGYEVKVGTECEFYLFLLDEKGMPTMVPHDHAGYCDLAPLDKGENVRREIVLTLEKMGIEPLTSHHENGWGQNEIDFKHSSAMEAADNFSTFKMTVKTVANQDGLFATFLPKPFDDSAGSGLHMNLSLYKDGQNLFTQDSPESKSFIAGIMNRIREITAFLNPLHQSYNRLGEDEAPAYVSWSKQNRSQLIRVPAATGDNMRIELRSPDPSCNQYLALALIIAAGMEGVRQKMPLAPSTDINLFTAKASELKNLKKLPETLDEALKLAQKSDWLKTVLPVQTIDAFINAKTNSPDPEFGEI